MLQASFLHCRRRPSTRDWWAYLGSFGDDFFDDDDDETATRIASHRIR